MTSEPYLILAGIDYSTPSELALERALEIATSNANAELHVVHVVSSVEPTQPNTVSDACDPASSIYVQNACEQLNTYVAISVGAFQKKNRGSPPRELRVVAHLRVHAPAREIAQLASDLAADLVVVGMHGRGTISRFFLGSVAETVTRLAPCPVLVFRPKGIPPEYPKIEPPCPRCVEERIGSKGVTFWCEQHRERHGQRHTYYQSSRMSEDVNLPFSSHRARPDA